MRAINPVFANDSIPIPRVVSGTSDTLQVSDARSAVHYTSATTVTIAIPANTFAVGESIPLVRMGTGAFSFDATAVTLRIPAGYVGNAEAQYNSVTLYHAGNNEFILLGRLATA